jgi:hypothetical protein
VELIELPTCRPRPTGLPTTYHYDLRFAADGRLLVTDENGVRVIDPATGKRVAEVPWAHGRHPVTLAADGKLAVTVSPTIDRLNGTRWDLTSGKATGSWDASFQNPFHSDTSLAWAGHLSPDGGWLGLSFHHCFLGDPEGHAILLDARTGRVVAQWKSREPHNYWTFSGDSRSFVVFPSRAGVEVRETATGGLRLAAFAGNSQLKWSLRAAAFSPDGGAVALAHSPGPVGLWDLIGQPAAEWKDEDPDRLWAALGGEDAEKAFAAIRHLRRHPAEAVAFLKARVQVPTAPSAEWITERIKLLDAAQFRDRERATGDLAGVGELVAAQLRAALKGASPEGRRRLDALLERVDAVTPDVLRAVRACEALEGIGSAAAREVLAAWAKGPAGATLTREAGESLERLGKRGR